MIRPVRVGSAVPVLNDRATGYVASLPSPQREICQCLRELILENIPDIREEFKWNHPAYYSRGKRICLTGGFREHVSVELFYGVHLQDSQGRIVGVGKNTRHIKFKSLEEIDANYFVDLVRQSVALSQAGSSD
jgi:hypothetical protein